MKPLKPKWRPCEGERCINTNSGGWRCGMGRGHVGDCVFMVADYMPVKLVRQEHSHECGIACIAMIAGLTLEEARNAFDQRYPGQRAKGRGVTDGITYVEVDAVLAELGFAVARLWKGWKELRPQWPLGPFAEVNLVQVYLSNGAHYVVQLGDGTYLDPAGERTYPADSIEFVAAVVPVAARSVHDGGAE